MKDIKKQKIEEENNFSNKKIKYIDDNKSKLDANFDNTDFYLLSLRHILEKEKIYNNLNKNLERQKTYTNNLISDNKSSNKNHDKYHSQFKPLDVKRINIIICDDEYEVARAAEEIVKRYFKKKGFNPHVYYTKNGI